MAILSKRERSLGNTRLKLTPWTNSTPSRQSVPRDPKLGFFCPLQPVWFLRLHAVHVFTNENVIMAQSSIRASRITVLRANSSLPAIRDGRLPLPVALATMCQRWKASARQRIPGLPRRSALPRHPAPLARAIPKRESGRCGPERLRSDRSRQPRSRCRTSLADARPRHSIPVSSRATWSRQSVHPVRA